MSPIDWKTVGLWLPLLILPWLPIAGFYPVAASFAAVVLVAAISLSDRRPEWSLLHIGGGLLGVAALCSMADLLVRRDISAWHGTGAYVWLAGTAVFVGSSWMKRGGGLRQMNGLVLASLVALLLWVARYAFSASYAELTALLSYQDGPGNISQIAMFASMALLLIHSTPGKQFTYLLGGILLALPLAFWLDSKLLLAVIGLVAVGQMMGRVPLRYQRWLACGLLVFGTIAILVLQPKSLLGRIHASEIIFGYFDPSRLFGQGIGELDTFLNTIFLEGRAVNTIGEIGPIAFNDYGQALVELGYPGLLALVILSVAVLYGKRPLGGLGWILLTAVMFPLQYVESAVLWGATAAVLAWGGPVWRPIPGRRILPWSLAGIGLALALFFTGTHYQWYRADVAVTKAPTTENTAAYAALEGWFHWNDDFHRKLGFHYDNAGRPGDALLEYELAAGVNPSYPTTAALADGYYAVGKVADAMVYYDQAARLRPQKLYPAYRKVYCLTVLEQKKEARTLANALLQEYAGTVNPYQLAMLEELRQLVAEENLVK